MYDDRWVGGRFAANLPFFGIDARVWQERGSRRQNVGEIRVQEEDCLCVAIECRDRATADRVELRRVAFGHGVHQPPAHARLTCVVSLECHDDASSEEVEEREVAERENPSNSRDRPVLPMRDWESGLSEVEVHDVGGARDRSRAIHVTPERPVPVPPEHHVRVVTEGVRKQGDRRAVESEFPLGPCETSRMTADRGRGMENSQGCVHALRRQARAGGALT